MVASSYSKKVDAPPLLFLLYEVVQYDPPPTLYHNYPNSFAGLKLSLPIFQGGKRIQDVRQGKFFEIRFDSGIGPDQARAEVERMAKDVLSNPVIENYRIELDSEPEP